MIILIIVIIGLVIIVTLKSQYRPTLRRSHCTCTVYMYDVYRRDPWEQVEGWALTRK